MAARVSLRQRVLAVLDHPAVLSLMVLLTVVSLFGDDVRISATHPSSDPAFLAVFIAVIAVFTVHILLQMYARPGFLPLPAFATSSGWTSFTSAARAALFPPSIPSSSPDRLPSSRASIKGGMYPPPSSSPPPSASPLHPPSMLSRASSLAVAALAVFSLGSAPFWLELASLVSIALEVPQMSGGDGGVLVGDSSFNWGNLTLLRAGRTVRAGARLAQVLQLLAIVERSERLQRWAAALCSCGRGRDVTPSPLLHAVTNAYSTPASPLPVSGMTSTASSSSSTGGGSGSVRVGAALNARVLRRVIAGVLLLTVIVPLLSLTPDDSSPAAMAATIHTFTLMAAAMAAYPNPPSATPTSLATVVADLNAARVGNGSTLTPAAAVLDGVIQAALNAGVGIMAVNLNGTRVALRGGEDDLSSRRASDLDVLTSTSWCARPPLTSAWYNATAVTTMGMWNILQPFCSSSSSSGALRVTTAVTVSHFPAVQQAAWWGIAVTILVIAVLGLGAGMFSYAISTIVLRPLEEMVEVVRRVSNNPLEAIDGAGVRSAETNAEVRMLLRTLLSVGSLLRMSFGDSGAGTITSMLNSAKELNPCIPGRRVHAVFVYVRVHRVPELSAALQGETPLLLNAIAKVVHDVTVSHGGIVVKNTGTGFVLAWLLPRVNDVAFNGRDGEEKDGGGATTVHVTPWTRVADLSLLATLRCLMQLGYASQHMFGDSMSDTSSPQAEVAPMVDVSPPTARSRRSLLAVISPRFASPAPPVETAPAAASEVKHLLSLKARRRLRAALPDTTAPSLVSFAMHAGWAIEGPVGSDRKLDAAYLSPHITLVRNLAHLPDQYASAAHAWAAQVRGISSDGNAWMAPFVDVTGVAGVHEQRVLLSHTVQALLSREAQVVCRNVDRLVVMDLLRSGRWSKLGFEPWNVMGRLPTAEEGATRAREIRAAKKRISAASVGASPTSKRIVPAATKPAMQPAAPASPRAAAAPNVTPDSAALPLLSPAAARVKHELRTEGPSTPVRGRSTPAATRAPGTGGTAPRAVSVYDMLTQPTLRAQLLESFGTQGVAQAGATAAAVNVRIASSPVKRDTSAQRVATARELAATARAQVQFITVEAAAVYTKPLTIFSYDVDADVMTVLSHRGHRALASGQGAAETRNTAAIVVAPPTSTHHAPRDLMRAFDSRDEAHAEGAMSRAVGGIVATASPPLASRRSSLADEKAVPPLSLGAILPAGVTQASVVADSSAATDRNAAGEGQSGAPRRRISLKSTGAHAAAAFVRSMRNVSGGLLSPASRAAARRSSFGDASIAAAAAAMAGSSTSARGVDALVTTRSAAMVRDSRAAAVPSSAGNAVSRAARAIVSSLQAGLRPRPRLEVNVHIDAAAAAVSTQNPIGAADALVLAEILPSMLQPARPLEVYSPLCWRSDRALKVLRRHMTPEVRGAYDAAWRTWWRCLQLGKHDGIADAVASLGRVLNHVVDGPSVRLLRDLVRLHAELEEFQGPDDTGAAASADTGRLHDPTDESRGIPATPAAASAVGVTSPAPRIRYHALLINTQESVDE